MTKARTLVAGAIVALAFGACTAEAPPTAEAAVEVAAPAGTAAAAAAVELSAPVDRAPTPMEVRDACPKEIRTSAGPVGSICAG